METCYRHPDRETGVSCSNCGRPICPECMTPTSVGMRCPECAGERTQVRTAAAIRRSDEPSLTYLLIGVNVAIAIGSLLGGGFAGSALTREMAVSSDAVGDGEVWRLVTSGFAHYGLAHLLFNMFSLWILGSLLEPAIGRAHFALIYFVSLFAGSFGALLVSPDSLTAGASGAVFGLMGAAVVIMRNRGVDLMASGLPLWLGLNLLITFAYADRISVGGHIGGLIGGALAAAVLYELRDRVRMPPALPMALTIALGALAVAGAIAISG
jgi:membrane associated rhomboid family serine protease